MTGNLYGFEPKGTVLVAGAGGFIGGHMVSRLTQAGVPVRAVDLKPTEDWYQLSPDAENRVADLSKLEDCQAATHGITDIFNFAADMGGMGFIENNKALCMLSVLINTHLLVAAKENSVERLFFSSSACVYAAEHQTDPNVTALSEPDAYPAMPEDGYGSEKLFSERMCRHFREDMGIETRVARYHNVYGPHGTWDGGREKAPAAICRKFARADLFGETEIEVWGDGKQTRSFMYIDDCIDGTLQLMASDISEPINIGSAELVSIDELVGIVGEIAGVEYTKRYKTDAPQGVRGRNSDNTLIRRLLAWEPSTSLKDGLLPTYRWVMHQVSNGAASK